jgi:hypothetical protein
MHHKGSFHFLTDLEHVVVYDIFRIQEDGGGIHFGPVCVHHYNYLIQGEPHSSKVRARYLVESREELLMVVRFTGDSPRWVPRTGAFQVYQATQLLTDSGLVQFSWNEMTSLDGRMLFVARGCSRSYDVADFPGLGFKDGIYFLDDQHSNNMNMVAMSRYGVARRQFTCSDNGRCQWVEGEPRLQVFQHWFKYKQHFDYSSPIWFIP